MKIIVDNFKFSAAHLLPGHRGLCQNLHGHTYRLKVEIESDEIIKGPLRCADGMIVDFKDLKDTIKRITNMYDHATLINTHHYFKQESSDNFETELHELLKKYGKKVRHIDGITTSENIVRQIHGDILIAIKLEYPNLNMKTFTLYLYESDTSYVTYTWNKCIEEEEEEYNCGIAD